MKCLGVVVRGVSGREMQGYVLELAFTADVVVMVEVEDEGRWKKL